MRTVACMLFSCLIAAVVIFGVLCMVVGCGGSVAHYYPEPIPHTCKVSDGYCYHRYISNYQTWVDVWIWEPSVGWKFHHTELAQ